MGKRNRRISVPMPPEFEQSIVRLTAEGEEFAGQPLAQVIRTLTERGMSSAVEADEVSKEMLVELPADLQKIKDTVADTKAQVFLLRQDLGATSKTINGISGIVHDIQKSEQIKFLIVSVCAFLGAFIGVGLAAWLIAAIY